MNTKVISAIAFKLFAIYVVVSAIVAIPTVMGIFLALKKQLSDFDVGFIWPSLIIISSAIVTFFVFKALWKLGDSIIHNISEINVPDDQFDIGAFEKTLFVFLGLYFSISAFVEFPDIATSLWVRSHTPAGILPLSYASLASTAAQLIIGLSLIKKPNQWLSFIRNAGVNK